MAGGSPGLAQGSFCSLRFSQLFNRKDVGTRRIWVALSYEVVGGFGGFCGFCDRESQRTKHSFHIACIKLLDQEVK